MQVIDVQDPIVDVLLQMPSECFFVKDYLNHRYHAKRLAYLQHAAALLQAAELASSPATLHSVHGDLRRLAVQLPLQMESQTVMLCLHAGISDELFSAAKLAPDRNCLRSAAVPSANPAEQRNGASAAPGKPQKEAHDASTGADDRQLLATPAYNASVLADVFVHQHFCNLAASSQKLPGLLQALLALRRWVQAQMPPMLHLHAVLQGAWACMAGLVQVGAVVCFSCSAVVGMVLAFTVHSRLRPTLRVHTSLLAHTVECWPLQCPKVKQSRTRKLWAGPVCRHATCQRCKSSGPRSWRSATRRKASHTSSTKPRLPVLS